MDMLQELKMIKFKYWFFSILILKQVFKSPKGTVELSEDPATAVIIEIKEETGLNDFNLKGLLAEDYWIYDDGALHHRFFYLVNVSEDRDEWVHYPTGEASEEGLLFKFFWLSSKSEIQLIRGHGDYLDLLFS